MYYTASLKTGRPADGFYKKYGDVAQLGEHCLRKAGVEGSNPFISTRL